MGSLLSVCPFNRWVALLMLLLGNFKIKTSRTSICFNVVQDYYPQAIKNNRLHTYDLSIKCWITTISQHFMSGCEERTLHWCVRTKLDKIYSTSVYLLDTVVENLSRCFFKSIYLFKDHNPCGQKQQVCYNIFSFTGFMLHSQGLDI